MTRDRRERMRGGEKTAKEGDVLEVHEGKGERVAGKNNMKY